MPPVSEAQRRLMQAAAHTKGGVGGVPQSVGKEFASADKGGKLPAHKKGDDPVEPKSHKKGWVKKKDFHPGGEKGKLHRELNIKEDKKIPSARLEQATHSKNPEVRRDAIRAQTMKSWHHGKSRKEVGHKIYGSKD